MKAQRRHDLKENELSHALDTARKYLDQHGKGLATIIVLVAAVVILTGLTVRSRTTAKEDRWRAFGGLSFVDVEIGRESLAALRNLRQDVSDAEFVLPCLLSEGQQALRLSALVDDPPDRALTEQAQVAFEEVLRRFSDNRFAFGAAQLGLAATKENLFALGGDLALKSEVAGHLATVIDAPQLDGLPFKAMALERRESIDKRFERLIFAEPVFEEPVDEGEPELLADPADMPLTDQNVLPISSPATSPAESGSSDAGGGGSEPVDPPD